MARAVFVLRPEPGLAATMKRGCAMGLPMEAMPLSHAESVAWRRPAGAFDGILLGSANGLRLAGDSLQGLADLPVYAVGQATADTAQALGFTVAKVGAGGLQRLVESLPEDRPLRLLRLAGDEHLPLAAPDHIAIETAVTYAIVHRPLGDADAARLARGGVVLLHSGASAQHFADECGRIGLDRANLSLAALAPRIGTSVPEGWKSLRVAATPDDAALLSLAADM
ncbi:uroporphyrinogen-III synthase [Alteriqipengyuania sp. 357]